MRQATGHRLGSYAISINNPRCTSLYLRCQVQWGTAYFRQFRFSVGDVVSAHSYVALGHPIYGRVSLAEATALSAAEGRAWIVQHEEAIKDIVPQVPIQFVTWQDWRNHDLFGPLLAYLRRLSQQSLRFRQLVSIDVDAYLTRRKRMTLSRNSSEYGELVDYVIEELAVRWLQAEVDGDVVIVHVGGTLRVCRNLRTITGIPPCLANHHYAFLEIRPPQCIDRRIPTLPNTTERLLTATGAWQSISVPTRMRAIRDPLFPADDAP